MSGVINPLPVGCDPTIAKTDYTPVVPAPVLPEPATAKPRSLSKIPYSKILAEHICDEIANGGTLSDINLAGIRTRLVIKQWEDESEEFRELLRVAKRARADVMRDNVQHTAANAEKDENRLKGYMWLAAHDDPKSYGTSSESKSNQVGGIQIVVVNTGVPTKDVQASPPELRNDPIPEIKSVIPSYQPNQQSLTSDSDADID